MDDGDDIIAGSDTADGAQLVGAKALENTKYLQVQGVPRIRGGSVANMQAIGAANIGDIFAVVDDTGYNGLYHYTTAVLTPDNLYVFPATGIGAGYWVHKDKTPWGIVDTGEFNVVFGAGGTQTFTNQSTYVDITNAFMNTNIACQTGDLLDYEFDMFYVDNNISLGNAFIGVYKTENAVGIGFIKEYSIPHQNFQANITAVPLVPIAPKGRTIIVNPGIAQVKLQCHGQASDSQIVVQISCVILGRFTVYRP